MSKYTDINTHADMSVYVWSVVVLCSFLHSTLYRTYTHTHTRSHTAAHMILAFARVAIVRPKHRYAFCFCLFIFIVFGQLSLAIVECWYSTEPSNLSNNCLSDWFLKIQTLKTNTVESHLIDKIKLSFHNDPSMYQNCIRPINFLTFVIHFITN